MSDRTVASQKPPDPLHLLSRYFGRVAKTDDPKEHQRVAAEMLEEMRRAKRP